MDVDNCKWVISSFTWGRRSFLTRMALAVSFYIRKQRSCSVSESFLFSFLLPRIPSGPPRNPWEIWCCAAFLVVWRPAQRWGNFGGWGKLKSKLEIEIYTYLMGWADVSGRKEWRGLWQRRAHVVWRGGYYSPPWRQVNPMESNLFFFFKRRQESWVLCRISSVL